jgi:hypothetical protein
MLAMLPASDAGTSPASRSAAVRAERGESRGEATLLPGDVGVHGEGIRSAVRAAVRALPPWEGGASAGNAAAVATPGAPVPQPPALKGGVGQRCREHA